MIKKVSKLHFTLIIFLLAIIVGFTVWVIFMINGETDELSTGAYIVDKGSFIRSETVYVLIVFLIALIIMLAVTIVSFLIENRTYKKINKSTLPTGKRFSALAALDETYKSAPGKSYENIASLDSFCSDFRDFSASRLGLYYEISDVRSFIAGLGVSKLVIMQGLSGTGKTSLATALGEYINNKSVVISIQPMWKERSDMLGYYNEFTKKFTESTFLKTLYEASYTDDIYVVVLDEMNIARVEYYFADFLSQLELSSDNRFIEIVSDKWGDDPSLLEEGKLKIPENVWFVGTANNDDSTFAISDKVYDRAMLVNLDKKSQAFVADEKECASVSYGYLTELFKAAIAQNSISDDSIDKLKKLDEFLIQNYQITYGNRMFKQLEEFVAVYVACGGSELDAVDDFFSKKVLRKLEGMSPVVLKNAAAGLSSLMAELFGITNMTKSQAYLGKIGRL